jgi:uncharacterized protein (TIGR02145 family)
MVIHIIFKHYHMKTLSFIIVTLMLNIDLLYAQVGINTDASNPDQSAILDAKSSSKGFLPPRMTTTQMNDISSPAAGLMVYNTTLNSICWFNGTSWDIGTNRDGQSCGSVNYGGTTYNSVIIGMQCWMTQNLNIGTAILESQDQTNNTVIEKYCYNNSTANCDVYGGLYQWAEMVQYINGATNTTSWSPVPTGNLQGICPSGWHLPGDAEWSSLTTYLGGESVAGGKMKETGTTHWLTPNTGATNSSGFTALPGGYRYTDGNPYFLPLGGYFWSASDYAAPHAWGRYLYYTNAGVFRNYYIKSYGYSVRCLRD